jgi:protein-S-isoprenylcysteine O-methyltransferase Ste14
MTQSFLARRRVALGLPLALFVLYFAAPTIPSMVAGACIAVVGQGIRLWAAGHLEKSREVTVSGPYRFTRHPLYLGSSIMGVGVIVACQSAAVAVLVALYMGLTISSAIRSEEAFLRERFGSTYDDYARSQGPRAERRFSWARAWRNKEYRAVAGLVLFLGLLTVRMALAGP